MVYSLMNMGHFNHLWSFGAPYFVLPSYNQCLLGTWRTTLNRQLHAERCHDKGAVRWGLNPQAMHPSRDVELGTGHFD